MVREKQNRIHGRQAGFSLLELTGVAAISMIVTMTAVPNMINSIGNIRLRSSMTSLAGVLQNCRMMAVKNNATMTTHFDVTSYSSGTGVKAYVKKASDSSSALTSDSQVQLEEPITQVTTLSGAGAPTINLDNTVLGFTPQTGVPSFNPTGLPCGYSSGNCPSSGFVYYFHDQRPAPKTGWAALSISPAGRLKKWYWSGSAWTD
jgi:Tfp pilus assembly protein FimT